MKVLVTGGAGFIGSHIIDVLEEKHIDYFVVDNLSTGKLSNLPRNANFYKVDILDAEFEKVFSEELPTHVIHLAAQSKVNISNTAPLKDGEVNILGTLNVLKLCKEYSCKKIIYSSSAAVYGNAENLPINEDTPINPVSNYGISKFTPELYIKCYAYNYGIEYTILRYSNVFGPRQTTDGEGGVISIFLNNIINGKKNYIFGDGEQTRDFIYVKDIAQANLLSLFSGHNQTINISTGKSISINELYSAISTICKNDLLPIYELQRLGDIKHNVLSNERALSVLKWRPIYSLNEALLNMISISCD
ncbi:NAD-dependent epimerase/dehydratase family protein [Paenibacillus polymyxa]|uniref:NAD-dependent epimerase/dehydratase family protein n=1 Tax=Paenibacillus polymyxa TaxID=1406 RepID=UPI00046ED390|nr:NAD-dependent epimerase/dehydratase family protein [Paenibacillus polymyxa]